MTTPEVIQPAGEFVVPYRGASDTIQQIYPGGNSYFLFFLKAREETTFPSAIQVYYKKKMLYIYAVLRPFMIKILTYTTLCFPYLQTKNAHSPILSIMYSPRMNDWFISLLT